MVLPVQPGAENGVLPLQVQAADGQGPQREQDSALDCASIAADVQPGQRRDELVAVETTVFLADTGRGGDELLMDLVDRGGACLDRRAAGVVQGADAFDRLVLHRRDPVIGQRSPRGLVGVDRVGLAQPPPFGSIGSGHLDDAEPLRGSGSSEAGAVGAAAFDADYHYLAVAGQERQRTAIPRRRRRKLAVTDTAASPTDRRDVNRLSVRVRTAEDPTRLVGKCHAGPAFHSMEVGTSRVGRQDSNEALARLS
jgi:hypothetical protein